MLPTSLMLLSLLAGAPDDGPNCQGFSGLVHGTSACARVELASNTVVALNQRVMPKDSKARLTCDGTARVGKHALALSCEYAPSAQPDSTLKKVTVRVTIDGKAPVTLHTYDNYYEFVSVWVAERKGGIDFTIDYGMNE